MKITSAVFKKGLKGEDSILYDGKPQVAFVGRSNVGKSSLINTITGIKNLARTSSFPGRTQELNVFLVNNAWYLIDLPGYGYAQTSERGFDKLNKLLYWYLFDSKCEHKIVLIIDANIGPQANDLQVLESLENQGKDLIIVANKIDKIRKSDYKKQMQSIEETFRGHTVIPFSSEEKIGVKELLTKISE